jgi:hypothetical protein
MVMGWYYLGGRATREDKMMETPNMKTYAEIARNRCDGDAQPQVAAAGHQ